MCIRLKAHLPHGRDPHCLMIKWTKPKVRVYSDSVLCLGKMHDNRDAIIRWKGEVEEFKMTASYKELLGIDGERIEFEWNFLPGFSSLQLLQKIQNDLRERNIEPENRPSHLHVKFQRHRLDKKRKRWNLHFEFRKSQGIREEILAGTLDVPRSWTRKEVVRRKMGLYCHSNGGTIQRYGSSSNQEYQCLESWNSEKRRLTETPYTSMRMLQTQSSCS